MGNSDLHKLPNNRVILTNGNPLNGKIGAIAKPLEVDVDEWLANGWRHKTKTPAPGGKQ